MTLFRRLCALALSLSLLTSPAIAATKTAAHKPTTAHGATKKTVTKKAASSKTSAQKAKTARSGAKSHSGEKETGKKETGKGAAKSKKTPAREDARAKTEAALRDQTDAFVGLIDGGKQSLTDARIAWGAKHPEIACQRARSARAQFGKARGVLDGMVKTAQDGKADTAPLKALYPKTDELDDATRKLIGMTCN